MAKRRNAFLILLDAVGRTLRSLHVILPLVLLVGGGEGFLMWAAGSWSVDHIMDIRQVIQTVYGWLGQDYSPYARITAQDTLWYTIWAHLPVVLIWGCLAIPVLDAAAIYCWRKLGGGETPSFGPALNWSLARYRRMVGPHAAAYITIQLGLIIIVPGILFGLQYAFVNPIAATDDKSQRPLKRSSKLTAGRRGRIAQAWIPLALWYTASQLGLMMQAEESGAFSMIAFGVLDLFLLTIMQMAMFGFYEERIEDARLAREARQANPKQASTAADEDEG